MTERIQSGWGNPRPADPKSDTHYFGPNGRSLCWQWLAHGIKISEDMPTGDARKCKKCAKIVEKRANSIQKPPRARRRNEFEISLLQHLVDADAVARSHGCRRGLCDAIDDRGKPSQSDSIAALLQEARERGIVPKVATGG